MNTGYVLAAWLALAALLPAHAQPPARGDLPPPILGKDRAGEVVDLAQLLG